MNPNFHTVNPEPTPNTLTPKPQTLRPEATSLNYVLLSSTKS